MTKNKFKNCFANIIISLGTIILYLFKTFKKMGTIVHGMSFTVRAVYTSGWWKLNKYLSDFWQL